MNPAARKQEILRILQKQESVQVLELARSLDVSKVTIRNDLDELENKGLLLRTYGGAVLPEKRGTERFIADTMKEYYEQKEQIARLASTLVSPGQNIIIDNGSTTVHLAKYLRDMAVTVTTSSLLVIEELMHAEKVDLIVSGGVLRRQSMGLMGNLSKDVYRQVHADWLFLGASGYSAAQGVFCTNLIEAETKQAMIQSATKVCLLVDSSKMERLSLARVCDWNAVDYVITDTISAEVEQSITEAGVKVLAVDTQ